MFCQTHKCIVLVYGVLALAAFLDGRGASANDKKDKAAFSGTWVRKEGELKVEFDGKGAMKLFPHGDNKNIAILFDYSVEKEKRVEVKVTGFEGEEKIIEQIKEKIPVGLAFSFQWTIKDKTAKLDEIKGKEDILEHLKAHMEGDYEKK